MAPSAFTSYVTTTAFIVTKLISLNTTHLLLSGSCG
jgi:hypothetical protein